MTDVEVAHPQLEPRRACQECNRKKTKCDMRRPVCGLCLRTGNTCSFPSKRKKPTIRKPQLKGPSRKIGDSLSKLVQVLEAASRTGEQPDAPNGAHELPHSLLRDSLKGLLAEINMAGDQNLEDNNRDASVSDDGEDELDDDDPDPEADSHLPLHPSPLHTPGVPNAKATVSSVASTPDVPIISSLAMDLVDIFFDKIQPWLPLLHRPRFHARYGSKLLADGDVMKGLSVDESILFYSIFAMSARFSTHPQFADIPAKQRGQDWAERARDVYTQARSLRTPTLTYLQGCILLAFYFYTSGPTPQGWILIGVCVRMAYELRLSEIDDANWAPHAPAGFVEKEEMRRAWWLVWELDTFASTVSRNPYAIDRKRMSVLLPISDEAWFAAVDVPSAELNLRPGQSWRSLHGSANQDERAWFLVSNSLMATIHDRLQQKQEVSVDEKLTLENEVCCFKLALPASLRLDIDTLAFTQSTFARCNWVIGTHLMLMATSFMVAAVVTTEIDEHSVSSLSGNGASPLRQRAIDMSRVISLWDSRYIALAHPFFTCMMLPPYASDSDAYKAQTLISSTHDLAKLVLDHFAEKWKLGSVASALARMLERGGPLNTEEKQLVKRYAVFFRIPRISVTSPPFFQSEYHRRDRKGSVISDSQSYTGRLEGQQQYQQHQQQQQIQHKQEYHPSLDMSGQAIAANTTHSNYEASVFDQSFPPQQPSSIFDGTGQLDFDFSDFFGGYKETDYNMLT